MNVRLHCTSSRNIEITTKGDQERFFVYVSNLEYTLVIVYLYIITISHHVIMASFIRTSVLNFLMYQYIIGLNFVYAFLASDLGKCIRKLCPYSVPRECQDIHVLRKYPQRRCTKITIFLVFSGTVVIEFFVFCLFVCFVVFFAHLSRKESVYR